MELGLTLRPFQARALAALRGAVEQRSLHVVAPPGSGKTVIGLAFLIERGWPTVVVSPTGTIAAQWIEKFEEFVVDAGIGDLPSPERWIGKDAFVDPAPLITSVTYQALSVKDRNDGSLHDNVERLFARFRELGVRTIVLDESHHLKNHWANAISAFVEATPGSVLLALTATPPVDATAEERRRHVSLVGDVDYEIALPALVKSGYLAPFQDLVYLVEPTEAEHAFLAGAHERFEQVWHTLAGASGPCDSLRLWLDARLHLLAESELDDPGAGAWGDLLRDEPDLAIAMGRVVRELGGDLPALLWSLDEMDERAQLQDKILTIEAYLEAVVLPAREERLDVSDPLVAKEGAEQIWQTVRGALRPIGFLLTRSGIQRRAASVDRVVGLSAAKYDGLVTILRAESVELMDDLRAVVVTDFERAATGKAVRELDGVLDPTAGGAVSVLRRLAVDPVLGDLEAVMVSGSSLVCDADVAGAVAVALRAHAASNGLTITLEERRDGALVEIVGRGPDWTSANYVLLVTSLFEEGVTRCLVGTRGLLGEGWDTKRANVLVDLTSVSAFVSTNQLRGRCLRLDPERPGKVADLWDVVTVAPAMERGFADWERLVRKHSHAFGLADDGEIERGVGHVHPTFTHVAPSELAPALIAINEEMLERAARRDIARDAWDIGGDYGDERIVSVELRPTEANESDIPPAVKLARSLQLVDARENAETARVRAAEFVVAYEENAVVKASEIEAKFQAALVTSAAQVREEETALVVVSKEVSQVGNALAATVVFGALATFLAANVVLGVSMALVLVPLMGITLRAESKKKSNAVALLESAKSKAARKRRTAERARDRSLERLAKGKTALKEKNRGLIRAADERVVQAEVSLETAVESLDEARLYGEVVLAGLRRLAERGETEEIGDDVAVVANRRVDGSISVAVCNGSAAQARTFGQALRGLVRPVGTQRYLLVLEAVGSMGETLDADTLAIPVPQPFAASRRGARAFQKAFRDVVGPAELIYTRSGEGRELLGRHARQRWSKMRGFARETWR